MGREGRRRGLLTREHRYLEAPGEKQLKAALSESVEAQVTTTTRSNNSRVRFVTGHGILCEHQRIEGCIGKNHAIQDSTPRRQTLSTDALPVDIITRPRCQFLN
jgi:hypothetical protein